MIKIKELRIRPDNILMYEPTTELDFLGTPPKMESFYFLKIVTKDAGDITIPFGQNVEERDEMVKMFDDKLL